jgi:hypothetical protein
MNYRWLDTGKRRQEYTIRSQLPPVIDSFPTFQPAGPAVMESTVEEEGGHTLFLSPGIQLSLTKTTELECGLQIPVVKPSDEDAWSEELVFHIGLAKYFF